MRGSTRILIVTIAVAAGPALGAPTNTIGVNAHQPAADILDACKSLGLSWVRIDFNWHQIQPKKGSTIDFSFFDRLIGEARKRGLKVFPTIGYGPDWLAEADRDGKPNNNVPRAGEYQKICRAAAAHYRGTITHWGLWNEPNLSGFFDGSKQEWIDRVVIEGIKGIRAGCPGCKVLGPELATVGSVYTQWTQDVIVALKKAGLKFDIFTWHNYSTFKEVSPSWFCWSGDRFEHDLDKHRVCFGVHSALSPREVMVNAGLGSTPVWLTETGYRAPVGDAARLSKMKTYYRRVLEEQLKRPWWTHTFFYEIIDDNTIADKWGMAKRVGSAWPASYTKKPVWDLVAKVLKRQPAFGGGGHDCNDGLDNDGDQKIDYPQDPGCISAADRSEQPGLQTVPSSPDAGVPRADQGSGTRDAGGPDRGASRRDGAVATSDLSEGPGDDAGAGLDAAPSSGDGGLPAGEGGCGCRMAEAPSTLSLFFLGLFTPVLRRRKRR